MEIRNTDKYSIYSNPVAFSLEYGKGLIHFIPYLRKHEEKKLLGVITQCAKRFLTKDIKTDEPGWAKAIKLPGEDQYNLSISEIEKHKRVDKTKRRT